MKSLRSTHCMAAALLCSAFALTSTSAAPITKSYSYDGTYAPNSGSPPPGQSTWGVIATGSNVIVPNNDNGTSSPGVANFNDPTTGGLLITSQVFTGANTPFSSNQATDTWTMEFNVKLYSGGVLEPSGQAAISFGFRDEYNGSTAGKFVMLSFYTTGIAFSNTSFQSLGASYVVSADDPFDDAFHTYKVVKYIDSQDSQGYLAVYIDGVAAGSPVLYSSLNNASLTQGFGIYELTPTTVLATVDYITLNPSIIPEPSSTALLLLGFSLTGVTVFRRRNRGEFGRELADIG